MRCRSRTRSGSRSGNRVMSPTSTSSRAAPEGPMPCRSSSDVPVAASRARELLVGVPCCGRRSARRSADQLGRDPLAGLARRRHAGAPPARSGLGLRRGQEQLRSAGHRVPAAARAAGRSCGCAPHPGSGAGRPAAAAPSSCSSATTGRSPAIRVPTSATECASVASVLRPCPVANTRARADSFGGTSTTCSPSARSRFAMCRPIPLQPSIAQTRSGHRRTYSQHRGVARRCRWRTGHRRRRSRRRSSPRS